MTKIIVPPGPSRGRAGATLLGVERAAPPTAGKAARMPANVLVRINVEQKT